MGTGYITAAYIVGAIICYIVSLFTKAIIKYSHFELFVKAKLLLLLLLYFKNMFFY